MERIARPFFIAVLLASAPLSASGRTTGSLQYLEPYIIEQLGPGMRVNPNSKEYKEYKCQESEQYAQSVVCRRTKRVGNASHVVTILHLYNNIVTYINKSVVPAIFTRPEIDSEIDRLSRRFNQSPHIYTSTEGLIATWGDIQLRSLGESDLTILAQGGNPRVGFMVGFLPDPHESARAGLPIYSLSGGKGYIWIASVGKSGRTAMLRFLAADPSEMDLKRITPPEPDFGPEPSPPKPPPPPPGPSPDLSNAHDRLEKAGRALTWTDEEYLSPEQRERYRFLKTAIEKMSSNANTTKVNELAAEVEKFIREADTTTEKGKELRLCEALRDELAAVAPGDLPASLSKQREEAILRASTLNRVSAISEIKTVRAALEDVKKAISDFNALKKLRDSAKRKIEQIEEKIGLILDEEIQKQLQQRITDAKTALQSGDLSDAQRKVSDLVNYYDAHSEGNNFQPN